MLRKYFNRVQELHHQPSIFFLLILVLRNLLIYIFRLPGNAIKVSLFSYANNLSSGATPSINDKYPEIEILFVSTKKDFGILVHSIRAAQESTKHHSKTSTSIVVPDAEYLEARALLLREYPDIKILRESEFLTDEQITRIRNRFGKRSGWVIQQLLKVEYVSRSKQMGVLVVDSDTLLLEPRVWINEHGRQILTPSWEWHQPYYDFLVQAGFEIGTLTKSFVSHHMLMQPKYMQDARSYLGWQDLDVLITYLILNSDIRAESPFCIEFELYAQFVLAFHSEKIVLSKWSNIGVSRESADLDSQISSIKNLLTGKFASISLHAYL